MLRQPSSGYDVKKTFDSSLRNFWKAELSQIYPQLQKLEAEGLLTSEEHESEQGPNRRVYACTEAGRQELREWLEAGPTVGVEKIGFLAQTFFLGELDDIDAAITFMRKLRDYYATTLSRFHDAETRWSQNPAYPDDLDDKEFYAQLTLDCGVHRVSATLEWCNKTIARLEKRKTS
jgi:DNA-binding PadR family transcriptional regulator